MQPTEAERRRSMRELQRMADWVCVLILNSDLPAIDIEIEKNKVREHCLELYPDREELYEMVYENQVMQSRLASSYFPCEAFAATRRTGICTSKNRMIVA